MAATGNEVEIVVKTKDQTSQGAKAVKKSFDDIEKSGRDLGGSFDRVGEQTDDLEGKAQGFRSTLTGTQDSMLGLAAISQGNLFEGLVLLGGGVADLAEGFTKTLVPMAKMLATTAASTAANAAHAASQMVVRGATVAWTAAQWLLNAALTANPIGLVIAAIVLLVAAIVIAYKRSETFRDIVQGAFQKVKQVGGDMVGFIVRGFRLLLTIWLTVAGGILRGAAAAFGWVPGIGPKLKRASDAFNRMKDSILATLRRVEQAAFGFGQSTSAKYAAGILSNLYKAKASAAQVANVVRTHLREQSPAEEGPLSEGGGTEGWGRTAAELFAKGLGEGVPAVRRGLGGMAPAAAGAGRGGPGGGQVVLEVHPGGSGLDDLFITWLRKSIRVRGGDVQVVLGT